MAALSRYDVFLSFRGEDTRKNFVDHLRHALLRRGITTFRDDSDHDLPRGKLISPELIRGIEESRYVLVIFSENYASSTWCLEEIAKIVECKDISAGWVIPIFYHVSPSDVRKINGSFEKHFAKHKEDYKNNSQVLEKWKAALSIVANLSGEDLSDGYESLFIQKVVKEMENRLGPRFSYVADNLVGIKSRVAKVVQRLCLGESDVRSIGIWGMGGIGKTTIARAVYQNIRDQFEESMFLANVREVSKKNGLMHIQNQLLCDILKDNAINIQDVHQGANMIKEELQYKKVILVLDDVDKREQLERLVGGLDWFGYGSRIIITTRDEHMLQQYGVNYIYKVEALTYGDALELFCLKAFKSTDTPKEFSLLSQQVIKYTNGLPLALDVLGSFLFNRSFMQWQNALARLEECPNREIFNQLKISFDGLQEKEKEIFLDIACFFKGRNKRDVMEILERCGLYPEIGIGVLCDRSLITIEKNTIQMHDLVVDMGREIVRLESPGEPGKRSRIWLSKDMCHILTNNSGSANIKGIVLHSDEWRKERGNDVRKRSPMAANLKGESFSNMTNLRLLMWDYCGLESLPPSFHSWNLVELNMRCNSMRILWRANEMQFFEKLKVIDLSYSILFVETPNFNNVPNLERLICSTCVELQKVHPSIAVLQKLTLLDLSFCGKLKSLPKSVGNLSSLKVLNLHDCSCLEELPESIGLLKCLEELDISRTAIAHFPPGLAALEKLKILYLEGCDRQQTNFWSRSMLLVRCIINPRGSRWPLVSRLSNLTELDMRHCNLQEGEIPIDIGCLYSLRSLYLGGNNFTTIPASICDIPRLEFLGISNCKNLEALPRLPESIFFVDVKNCFQLKRISSPFILYECGMHCFGGWFINGYKFLPKNVGLTLQQKYYLSSLRYTIFCSEIESGRYFQHYMVSPSEYGIPEWFSFQMNGSFLCMEMPPRWFNKYWSGFAIYASLKWKNGFLWLWFPSNCEFFYDKAWETIRGSSHVNFRLSTDNDRLEVEKCGVHLVYKQNPADFDALLVRWASLSPQDWDGICHELHSSIRGREDRMTPTFLEDPRRAFKTLSRGEDGLGSLIWAVLEKWSFSDSVSPSRAELTPSNLYTMRMWERAALRV